jgi:hypothetical protein
MAPVGIQSTHASWVNDRSLIELPVHLRRIWLQRLESLDQLLQNGMNRYRLVFELPVRMHKMRRIAAAAACARGERGGW